MRRSLLLALCAPAVLAQRPTTPVTYQMNRSTIIMPCNYSGFTDPQSTKGWGLVDFDWSNAKGRGDFDGWAKHKPMDCEEMLVQQVQMTTSASPGTTVWVYRNSIKALPWYTSVRRKLEDPAYAAWFVPFNCSAAGPTVGCHVPVCDDNYDPPLCSLLYHDQEQTPGYPTGDGNCSPPACDTGLVPTGEYMFDPRAANVSINGQTLVRWFIDEYLFGPEGAGNANVSGFFCKHIIRASGISDCGGAALNPDPSDFPTRYIVDDEFDENGPSEYEAHVNQDIGFDDAMLASTSAAYWAYMAQVYTEVLERKKFVWQQLWNGVGTSSSTVPPATPPKSHL